MQVLWIWHRTCIRIKNYCLFALHRSTNRKEVSSRYLNYKLSTSWASHSRTWSQIKFKAEMFKKKKESGEGYEDMLLYSFPSSEHLLPLTFEQEKNKLFQ